MPSPANQNPYRHHLVISQLCWKSHPASWCNYRISELHTFHSLFYFYTVFVYPMKCSMLSLIFFCFTFLCKFKYFLGICKKGWAEKVFNKIRASPRPLKATDVNIQRWYEECHTTLSSERKHSLAFSCVLNCENLLSHRTCNHKIMYSIHFSFFHSFRRRIYDWKNLCNLLFVKSVKLISKTIFWLWGTINYLPSGIFQFFFLWRQNFMVFFISSLPATSRLSDALFLWIIICFMDN